jgi:outer membrane cobalamin receptor
MLSSLAVLEERQTDALGRYRFEDLRAGTYKLLANVPGFSAPAAEVSVQEADQRSLDLKLRISALQQQVVVSASLGGGVLTPQIGSSVNIVSHQEMEDRGAQSVLEVLSGIPGVEVNQTGRRGGVTGVFIRGGNSNYNLVMIDGIELNQFGGDFDFAPLAVDGVDRVEVTRGPESALYGSNAVTGVVDIISRRGEGSPHFSALAEGGSYATRRFATGGSGLTRGLSWAYDLSRLNTNGVVRNDNYRNQSAFASLGYEQGQRRHFDFHFFGDANDVGAPGPFGSDPDHLYDAPIYSGGLTPREVGLTARDKQNLFGYQGDYSEQFSARFRQVTTTSFATNDYYFSSILGDSFSNNFRGVFNTRSEVSLSSQNLLVGGFEYNREHTKNTYIADNSNTPFLLPRTSFAYFAEDRWNPSGR